MTNKTPANLWKPGQSGNPAGRPPGQSVITRLRAQIEPDAPAILQVMVAAAKGGDIQAARLTARTCPGPTLKIISWVGSRGQGDGLTGGERVTAGGPAGDIAWASGDRPGAGLIEA